MIAGGTNYPLYVPVRFIRIQMLNLNRLGKIMTLEAFFLNVASDFISPGNRLNSVHCDLNV